MADIPEDEVVEEEPITEEPLGEPVEDDEVPAEDEELAEEPIAEEPVAEAEPERKGPYRYTTLIPRNWGREMLKVGQIVESPTPLAAELTQDRAAGDYFKIGQQSSGKISFPIPASFELVE